MCLHAGWRRKIRLGFFVKRQVKAMFQLHIFVQCVYVAIQCSIANCGFKPYKHRADIKSAPTNMSCHKGGILTHWPEVSIF